MTAVLCADALVFFGATGDLAHKMIFPALQALVRHGRLDIPIVGVANRSRRSTGRRHNNCSLGHSASSLRSDHDPNQANL